ncbi:MAG: hypothetical protein KDB98_05265, partial [Flavobacteriales bacterium]|nr:hypothetical protein [Flavobacteriales bacterium]
MITLSDYLDNYYPIPMLTKVYRKSYLRDYSTSEWDWLKQIRYMDNVMHMCDLMKGPALFLNEITGVYRIHGQSFTRQAPKETPWHIEEILLSHRHFADMCPPEFKDKYIAIRAMHYEKLMHFHLAQKNLRGLTSAIARFLTDDYAGKGIFRKITATFKCIKQHL